MKKLFLLLFSLISVHGMAQTAASYTFSAFTGSYSTISATGTSVTSILGDDITQTSIPIGFTFNFCGTNYTQLAACSNGFLCLANSGSAPYTNTSGNITGAGFLMPYWDDLYGNEGSCSPISHAYYQTQGTAPYRTFTFEWKDYQAFPWGGVCVCCTINMQVILYETTNVIDFVYSNSTYSGMTATIGIANSTSDWQTLNNNSSSPTPSSTTFYTSTITNGPTSSQVYRWANQCTGTPTAGTVHATVDSGCSSYTSTLSLVGTSGGSGITFQWQSSSDGITWANISGATSATYTATITANTWYRCIVTCTYSGSSSTSGSLELYLFTPPSAITGTLTICNGGSTTLSDVTSGGTWSSASPGIATVGSSSGVVTGVSPGTAIISYTMPTGCYATTTVTVVTAPAAISGSPTVCTGNTTTFTDATSGGTWSSSATGTATVGSSTGVVTGVASGTATISYAIGTCIATKLVTVNSSPSSITGASTVCVGFTTTLADSTPGGTWSSSIPFIATITPTTGIVTGVFTGCVTITYMLPTGCFKTFPFCVNGSPSPITGIPYVCVGQTTPLYDAGGGTWTSSAPTIASVGSLTGVVTGMAVGSATITYTLPSGCYTTLPVFVAADPGPITGSSSLCVGATDTLSDTSAGGYWFSSNPSVGSIDPVSGVLTGVSSGIVTISYTVAGSTTSCSSTLVVTVNSSPSPISGTPSVCVGSSTPLFETGGGTWSTLNPFIAGIGATSGLLSGVSPGLTVVTYTLSTGCSTFVIATVNPLPSAIGGSLTVCVGLTTALTDASSGGTWSSSTPGVGTVSPAGVVTGIAPGTTTITYTLPTGCFASAIVTVNSSPSAIAGVLQVCQGSTTPLSDATPGGTWSITPTTTATITTGGVVTGVAPGFATVSYSIGAGCTATALVTVNSLPTISGPSAVCVGSTITLTGSAGGTWSSSSTVTATVGSASGIVTGVSGGAVNIIETITATGCARSKAVTVNALPALITGIGSACVGQTAMLSDLTAGGVWSIAPTSVATIGSSSGFVTAVSPGTATVTYSLTATSCSTTKVFTVNALPPLCLVTGGGSYCAGGAGVHVFLSCSSIGVNYQLYYLGSALGAPISGTGGSLDFGLQTGAGTYTVIGTNAATGCTATMTGSVNVTVNSLPAPISGASAVCVGATTPESSAPGGGIWGCGPTSVATIGPSTGTVTGVSTGTATITYTLPTGCAVTKLMTVSLSPGPISTSGVACTDATTAVFDAVGGGLWSSSNTAVATVGSLSGIVTGGSITGTTIISYSLGSGCTVTKTLTVYASPAAVTGTLSVCQGATTALADGTSGGSWSSSALSIASIGSSTGIVTGVSAGTASIAYTVPSGCNSTVVVTVNPLPAPIGGSSQVCQAATIILTDISTGGVWSSGTTSIAGIGSTGVVTGVAPGTSLITYRLPTGCITTKTITVNAVPAAISGTPHVCVGLSTSLADATTGGTWSHTTPSVATLSGTTETGLSAGVDTVLYSLPVTGCAASLNVTVNPVPVPFTGPSGVCVGQTIMLSDLVSGGTWSSSNPLVASIGSSSGIVLGNAFGSTTITYTVGGCWITGVVNVISSPLPITGATHVCVGQTITLSDPSLGGVWSSSLPSQASVGSSTGVVTGLTSGTVIISYTLGTGCSYPWPVIVNPISPILGNLNVCQGQTTTLYDTTLGGTWSSGSTGIAAIGSFTGIVTGITAGTSLITYSLGTGCSTTATVTVNSLPAPIAGPNSVCAGQTVVETDATPLGVWSSSNPLIAGVSGGVVTGVAGGTAIISYTVPTIGCPATKTVTVNNTPDPILGGNQLCVGGTIVLSDPASPGGAWSSVSPAVATAGPITGIISGVSAGTSVISYSYATGCAATVIVTVDAAVPPLTGPAGYCPGAAIALTDAIPGGTWSSSNTSVVSPSMICLSPGTSLITYSVSAGCAATKTVTVNNVPGTITGSPNVCPGATTAFTDGTPGGAWSSSDTTIATIGATSGIATGVTPGPVTITYTLGTGCTANTTLVVNTAPAAISGTPSVCVGAVTSLTDLSGSGVWSSTAPSVGTVDASGNVTGIAAGVTTISYAIPGGCAATLPVTVNVHPGAVTGLLNLCPGNTVTAACSPVGGIWGTGTPGVVSVSSSGVVTGLATGSTLPVLASVTYTLGAGCSSTGTLYVNPQPSPVTGPNSVCATQAITLSDLTAGGAWSSTVPAIGTVDAFGDVTGISAGTTLISYTNTYGCAATKTVTVNAMPGPIMGSANVCLGGTSVLSDSISGGTWLSSNTLVATIGSTGVVHGVSLGTATIIYALPPAGSCFVTKVINVYPLPSVFTVTGGGNHCAGDAGVHIGLSGSSVGVNYMLYRGATAVGAFSGTGSALDFGLQTVGGVYTVIGTSTATGCSISMSGSASVGVIPTVTPAISMHATPGDTVCAGTTVSFTTAIVNGGSSPVYQWSINGIPVALTTGYSYIPADGDVVTVKLSSSATCPLPATVTATQTMSVQPFVNPTVALTVTPGDTVCQGTVVTVHAETGYAGSAPLFTWVKNGAPVAYLTGSGSYSWSPVDGDVIWCAMNSSYPCRLSNADTSTALTISVDAIPLPVISIVANPGTTISMGQPDTLTAVVSQATAPTYQWYINGVPVAGATSAVFVHAGYSYPDQDSVSCAVTSNGVCTVTSHEWVYINVTRVGLQQIIPGGDITVIPNPSGGTFTIKGTMAINSDDQVTMEITDMLGQQVLHSTIRTKGGKLNDPVTLNGVANGMYLLTLRSDAESRVFHLVVEK